MEQEFLHQHRSHGLRILFLLSGLLLPGLFPPLWFYFGQPSLLGDWQKQVWDFFIPPTFPLLLTYDWEHRPSQQIQAVSYKSPLLSKLAFQSLSCAEIGSHSFMRQILIAFHTVFISHKVWKPSHVQQFSSILRSNQIQTSFGWQLMCLHLLWTLDSRVRAYGGGETSFWELIARRSVQVNPGAPELCQRSGLSMKESKSQALFVGCGRVKHRKGLQRLTSDSEIVSDKVWSCRKGEQKLFNAKFYYQSNCLSKLKTRLPGPSSCLAPFLQQKRRSESSENVNMKTDPSLFPVQRRCWLNIVECCNVLLPSEVLIHLQWPHYSALAIGHFQFDLFSI